MFIFAPILSEVISFENEKRSGIIEVTFIKRVYNASGYMRCALGPPELKHNGIK